MNAAPMLPAAPAEPTTEPAISTDLLPSLREMAALKLFVSADITRPYIATIWRYVSDGGVTFVATDAHTMAVRRSGTHRSMTICAIADMAPSALNPECSKAQPPAWAKVLQAPGDGRLAPAYGFDPAYIARVGVVERAAGNRAKGDFRPGRISALEAKRQKAACAQTFAVWHLPSDSLGGWYWKLDTAAALWEGIIMPRRV